MSTTSRPSPGPGADASASERRGAPRYPTLQRCLVWASATPGPGGWHCIAYDVATTGIGIALPLPVPRGHILHVQPCGVPGARPLLARVVHIKPVEFVWFCGCELIEPIEEEELQAWLAVSLGWLRQAEPAPTL